MKKLTIKVISDAACNNLFKNQKIDNGLSAFFEISPIDQFVPSIINSRDDDFLLIHLTEFSFNADGASEKYLDNINILLKELDSFILKSTSRVIINNVAFNVNDISQDNLITSLRYDIDINLNILNFASKHKSRVILVDTKSIISQLGFDKSISFKNYSIMRFPYSKEIANRLKLLYFFHIKSIYEPKKKVIFVDADNTLWGGIVGEDGVHGIKIDKEYPGILYYNFQKLLLGMKLSGALLCMVTKNNLDDVLEVFDKRTMPLKRNDFYKIKASWGAKSESISDILKELNIDQSSGLFIDDNPFEINEVSLNLKTMDTILFDSNLLLNSSNGLYYHPAIYRHYITDEDRNKTDSYVQEAQRSELKAAFISADDYIKSLNVVVSVSCNNKDLIPRVSQLTQKTNQFNLTTKRYSVSEITDLMANYRVYSFSVKDKFGEMGVVGVVIVKHDKIDTFLLSCRAFGRSVERVMLYAVMNDQAGLPLFGEFLPTSKNMMTKNFYIENGFALVDPPLNGQCLFVGRNLIDFNNSLMELVWI